VTLTYPIVAPVKRAPLRFDVGTAPPGHVVLSNGDMSAECAVLKAWGTIRCSTSVTSGVYTWWVPW
jgi:hypothetical protein